MSAAGRSPADARAGRLANLLSRGRSLHWDNAQTLVAARLGRRLPAAMPARAGLVYRTAQLVSAVRFIEGRRYLRGAALDDFLAALFVAVSGQDADRIERMVALYAASFDDEARYGQTVSTDLCHALFGAVQESVRALFVATPRAVHRTTCLYCAETFGDVATVQRLSS